MYERMKMLRKALGLTQQDFADHLGVKRGTVANYEIGRNEPIDAVVSLICREFNVNERWLRTGEGNMFSPEPKSVVDEVAQKLSLSEFETMFLSAYMRLPKQQRDAFCNGMYDEVIKSMAQKTQPKIESRWERDARLLQEEAEALKRDAEKCSVLPPTKKA